MFHPESLDYKDNNLDMSQGFFTRETLFEKLLLQGLSEKEAYEFTMFVKRGRAHNDKKTWREMISDYNLPQSIIDFCESYRYLWSRSATLDWLRIIVLCAYYMKLDSHAYFSLKQADLDTYHVYCG